MISLEKTASWELLSWIKPNIQSFFLLWYLYINPRKKKEKKYKKLKVWKIVSEFPTVSNAHRY